MSLPDAPGDKSPRREASGWAATLALGYVRKGLRTVPALRRHEGPIRVQKHLEHEPGVCQHIIVHPPGGMAGGDSVSIDVELARGAHTLLTNPGATSWYRTLGPPARSTLRATVAADACLELLQREHIVFDGADVALAVELELASSARAIAWDIVALGRPHGDAPFVRGRVRSTLRVSVAGTTLLDDRLVLAADDPLRRSPLGLGGADVFATVVIAAPDVRLLLPACRALPSDGRTDRAGVTEVAGLLVGRWLGASVEPARAWLEALWTLCRPHALGRPAQPPRIWRT